MPSLQRTEAELYDARKAAAVTAGTATDAFRTLLAAAQASVAASNTTAQADSGAAGGTKTALAASAVLVAALDLAATAAAGCKY